MMIKFMINIFFGALGGFLGSSLMIKILETRENKKE